MLQECIKSLDLGNALQRTYNTQLNSVATTNVYLAVQLALVLCQFTRRSANVSKLTTLLWLALIASFPCQSLGYIYKQQLLSIL